MYYVHAFICGRQRNAHIHLLTKELMLLTNPTGSLTDHTMKAEVENIKHICSLNELEFVDRWGEVLHTICKKNGHL